MYCTLEELKNAITEDVLAQLTDDENGTVINETIVNDIITSSSTLIDGYLRGRYSLPLSGGQDIIKSIAITISHYKLKERRNKTSEADNKKYDEAISRLKDIAKGVIILQVSDADTTTVSPPRFIKISAPDKLITDDFLNNF